MAEPKMGLKGHDEIDSSATYDLVIIDITDGLVQAEVTLRFGGADSVDGTITNVTLPASGDKWAEDFWYEDSGDTDYQMMDENSGPDEVQGSQAFHLFELTSDAPYASAPVITCYDDSGRTIAEESLDGTAGRPNVSFVKCVGAPTTSAQPLQFWGLGSSQLLHDLETAGSVVLGAAAQGLSGDTAYMTCTTASINTTSQYFSLALSVPDDAATGTDAIDIILSIKYTYT